MLGDFIIINKKLAERLDTISAIKILRQKHQHYITFKGFHDLEVHLFQSNSDESNQKEFLFFGFLMYKGKYNEEAVSILLEEKNPDWLKIKGDYFIFYKKGSYNKIILDPLRKFHVFQLKGLEALSSSFLACGHLSPTLSINKMGVYEKLSLGYNMAPNTLFHEIDRLYDAGKIENTQMVVVDNIIDYTNIKYYTAKDVALNATLEVMNNQIKDYKSFFAKGVDLGLSDGLDSRLILALLTEQKISNIQLHTHAIEGVHDKEKSTAEIIADKMKLPLKRVKCQRLENTTKEQLEKIIFDNFIYFDGQNSFNMGAFAQNYTKWYKDQVMGDYTISLNGLGGEIFRNYYYTNHGKRNLKEFGKNWLFYRYANDYLPQGKFEEFWNNFKKTLSDRLKISIPARVDLKMIRRFYSEVNMPDGDAINNNAHNKFYYFITPFIEPEVLVAGYGILPYIGNSTLFEGEMIYRLNQPLATIKTHYGVSGTNRLDWRARLKYFIYATAPEFVNRFKLDFHKKRMLKDRNENPLLKHFENHAPETSKAYNFLKGKFPDINYKLLETDYYAQATALRLAECVYYFKEKL